MSILEIVLSISYTLSMSTMKGLLIMSTLEQTVSMLQSMPEEARVLVFNYTQKLFTAQKPASPFKSLTADDVLSDLEVSRSQIANGQGIEIKKALLDMGNRHGFV